MAHHPSAMVWIRHRGVSRAAACLAALVGVALVAGACSSAPPAVAPTVAPTPAPSRSLHLGLTATVQDVFNGLGRAGLHITANTAMTGQDGGDVVRKIFATYLGWPLDVTEYRSASALAKVTKWAAGDGPGRGEPPVAIAGSNILVTWGPQNETAEPRVPDAHQIDGLRDLVAALDRMLSPLKARTVVPVSFTAAVGASSPAPASAAP
jgi:hypothetical protein